MKESDERQSTAGGPLCPICESPGGLGEPCRGSACHRLGICRIPEEFVRAHAARQKTDRDARVGTWVGHFLIVERLGAGGMGVVLHALQGPQLRRHAAIKLLLPAKASDGAGLAQRFENEATALATLAHPNIVQLMAFGEADGRPFLAMEYVHGSRTLASEMRGHDLAPVTLPPSQVRHILDQVLFGLEAAHDAGIIHRDIKPDNIMLAAVAGNPCLVKLVDFGLAKFIAQSDATGVIIGTAQYLAPEQVLKRNIGPWTDLYAVGVLAFELLTGLRPFSGTATEIALRKIDPTAAAFDHANELPPRTRRFFESALAQAPVDRYPCAVEMRQALAALLEPEEPCPKPTRRASVNSRLPAFATVVILSVFALAAVFAAESRATSQAPRVESAVNPTAAAPIPAPVLPQPVRRPRLAARIDDGRSAMRGLCCEDDVRRTVAPHAAALRACYEDRLDVASSLAGSLELHWSINAGGRVDSATVSGDTMGDPQVGKCMADVIRGLSFVPPEVGICAVDWWLTLSPG